MIFSKRHHQLDLYSDWDFMELNYSVSGSHVCFFSLIIFIIYITCYTKVVASPPYPRSCCLLLTYPFSLSPFLTLRQELELLALGLQLQPEASEDLDHQGTKEESFRKCLPFVSWDHACLGLDGLDEVIREGLGVDEDEMSETWCMILPIEMMGEVSKCADSFDDFLFGFQATSPL